MPDAKPANDPEVLLRRAAPVPQNTNPNVTGPKGRNEMLRRITACAVLLALFSAYLTPLAAKAAPAAKSKKNAKPASKLAPDFITDAVMDALDAAAEFKGIAHFGETDFDMDGLAMLLFATRSFDLRHSPEGLAFHVSAVLNNPKVPTQM